jgi:hypothetical protein
VLVRLDFCAADPRRDFGEPPRSSSLCVPKVTRGLTRSLCVPKFRLLRVCAAPGLRGMVRVEWNLPTLCPVCWTCWARWARRGTPSLCVRKLASEPEGRGGAPTARGGCSWRSPACGLASGSRNLTVLVA